MTRREFIAGSAAFAAAPRAVADGADAPLMRLGMISDTHLVVTDGGSGVQNSLCFEPALRYFDSRKADGIVVCGDLTDFGTSSCLRHFASIWNSVFPGNKRSDGGDVVPLIILGDHDMGRYMHTKSWAPQSEDLSNIIPDHVADLWQECFGETWAPILVKECCGYKFVLAHHPEHNDESDHGNQIPGLAEFLAQQTFDASKPFFLMQHRIFKDTVLVPGCGWENGTTTEILKNYPNAIGLCGHGHCNAVDELCLWQNEFTAIQIPSLNFCDTRPGRENGYNTRDTDAIMPRAYITKSWQGMFGTMYADRFVVERRDFLNGLSLAADWTIPLPAPDGSLKTAVRARKSDAPEFPSCAKPVIVEKTVKNYAGTVTDAVVVTFPVAHETYCTPRTYDYAVAAKAGGTLIKEKYVYSKKQFWADGLDREMVECAFAKSDLPANWRATVGFSVAPRDSFGNRGREIACSPA